MAQGKEIGSIGLGQDPSNIAADGLTRAQSARGDIVGVAAVGSDGGIYDAAGNKIGASVALTATRATTAADSGAESIYNATSSSYTLTVSANTITKPTMVQQESTGTITLAAGAGVTFIGSSLATDKAGSLLSIIPTSTANTLIIVKGGL